MRIGRNVARVLAAGVIAVGGVSLSASSASARTNTCGEGEFCFYYNSGGNGAIWFTISSAPNLDPYVFVGHGAGSGQRVKNNAASVINNHDQDARVYFKSGYRGVSELIESKRFKNLTTTKNENASMQLLP